MLHLSASSDDLEADLVKLNSSLILLVTMTMQVSFIARDKQKKPLNLESICGQLSLNWSKKKFLERIYGLIITFALEIQLNHFNCGCVYLKTKWRRCAQNSAQNDAAESE